MHLYLGMLMVFMFSTLVTDSGSDGQAPPPIMGAWGICPYGNHVVVGDTMRGMLLFDFFPKIVSIDEPS